MTLVFCGYWFVYHGLAKPTLPARVVFNIVFFLALWSYLAASLTNPGTPACARWQMWARNLGPPGALPEGPKAPRCWMPGAPAFCDKCKMWRPERAHHCKALDTCVLRMDHFCPWIGNTVGFCNHKQFMLMNLYISCASLVGMLTLREPNVIAVLLNGVFGSDANDHMRSEFACVTLFIAVLVCLLFTLVTSALFASGLYYAAINVTQIERKYKSPNPYLLPGTWENIRQLFGSCNIWLFLPVHTTGSDCVGTMFPYMEKVDMSVVGHYGSTDSITTSAAIL